MKHFQLLFLIKVRKLVGTSAAEVFEDYFDVDEKDDKSSKRSSKNSEREGSREPRFERRRSRYMELLLLLLNYTKTAISQINFLWIFGFREIESLTENYSPI